MEEELIEGTTVEVCTDEDGFQGAWFAANIVKVMEKDKFFIRYKTIKTDDNKELLTEEVDAKHIRPRPPKVVAAESFSLTEEVDAFYNDGWWEGVIRKVLPGRRYKVYFKGTDDELMFQHSDLRPRQDWMDRTWVMASQIMNLQSVSNGAWSVLTMKRKFDRTHGIGYGIVCADCGDDHQNDSDDDAWVLGEDWQARAVLKICTFCRGESGHWYDECPKRKKT
ncbi:hypothetical protein C1H46_028555 [Malus baccata]|uniref:Agenet domain-containing protein n=1 Tax=Malus baccata TaxID=106549 RepID=A0A540LHB1_MALBA|nr:hypothetical protein C1H46_028555 [Malus baccata]